MDSRNYPAKFFGMGSDAAFPNEILDVAVYNSLETRKEIWVRAFSSIFSSFQHRYTDQQRPWNEMGKSSINVKL
jgi:hypothetical protein